MLQLPLITLPHLIIVIFSWYMIYRTLSLLSPSPPLPSPPLPPVYFSCYSARHQTTSRAHTIFNKLTDDFTRSTLTHHEYLPLRRLAVTCASILTMLASDTRDASIHLSVARARRVGGKELEFCTKVLDLPFLLGE